MEKNKKIILGIFIAILAIIIGTGIYSMIHSIEKQAELEREKEISENFAKGKKIMELNDMRSNKIIERSINNYLESHGFNEIIIFDDFNYKNKHYYSTQTWKTQNETSNITFFELIIDKKLVK